MVNNLLLDQRHETKELRAFIGIWRTTGNIYDDDGKITGKVNAIDTYRWLPGDYAVIHYIDGTMSNVKVNGIEIIGYDATRKAFFAPFFDNQGSAGWEELRKNGNEWTWRGVNVMGVKHHRCSAIFKNAHTIEARHEHSDDGERWKLWMSITLKRS